MENIFFPSCIAEIANIDIGQKRTYSQLIATIMPVLLLSLFQLVN